MSETSNLAAKGVNREADTREPVRRSIEVLAEAARVRLATKLKVVESLQFERGYN